jgi:glycosyltransferase involved in cell wall biosynthesis
MLAVSSCHVVRLLRRWADSCQAAGSVPSTLSRVNDQGTRAEISIGVPAYNEVESLPELHRRIEAVMSSMGAEWEMVVSDNSSTDGTREYLRELTARDPRVKAVLLARNFGHANSHVAALEYTSGDWTVLMDADLQDEPEALPEMINRAREGHDVVYAVRAKRPEGWLMRKASALFYRLAGRLSSVPQPAHAGPFCVLSRRAADEIRSLPERNFFFPGLRAYVGFSQIGVPLDRPPRKSGGPRLNLRARIAHGLDGILAFSDAPLRIAIWMGIVISALSGVLAVGFAVLRLFTNVFVSGITAVITIVLFIGGVQLFTLGIIGEYLGRVYNEVKRRPRYVVEETLNLDPIPPRPEEERARVTDFS